MSTRNKTSFFFTHFEVLTYFDQLTEAVPRVVSERHPQPLQAPEPSFRNDVELFGVRNTYHLV